MTESAALRSGRTLRLSRPLMSGRDVAALQRLLSPYHPGPVDGEYGPLTAAAVERATWSLGYPENRCNGVARPSLGGYLAGGALPLDFASRLSARARDGARWLARRDEIVAVARWGIAHARAIHYAELRPIEGLGRPWQVPLRLDCSGFVTLCYAWAGAPDPNGLDYDGQGYTGTLLAHLRPVPLDGVQRGDLVVWGRPPGVHTALVLEPGRDPLLCSHGGEKGPLAIRFSAEGSRQPQPAAWLTLSPRETAEAGIAPASGAL
jgi:cell wall-associated NlpC family hydrolase